MFMITFSFRNVWMVSSDRGGTAKVKLHGAGHRGSKVQSVSGFNPFCQEAPSNIRHTCMELISVPYV